MTQNEVINKLSMEMALALGDLDHLRTCKFYIQMALAIGIDHFTKEMEEIIIMNYDGQEIDRLKSLTDCETKLGIYKSQISEVLSGKRFSAGGLRFQKVKDKELVPARKTA
jgi:hypothetical protein